MSFAGLLAIAGLSTGGPGRWILVVPGGARGAALDGLTRLNSGLREAPPGWDRCFLLDSPWPADLERLVARMPGASIEQDPVLEPLLVGEPSVPSRSGGDASPAPGFWPDDPAFLAGQQWGLWCGAAESTGICAFDIGAPAAWARTTGSPSLRLALLDTGVDPDHPDLQAAGDPRGPRLTAFSAVFSGAADAALDVADSIGHGTMVCGVMAARTNNGVTRGGGIAGVAGGSGDAAPGPRVLSVKITSGKGSAARATDLARGIVLACEWGARAINISFASPAPSSILRAALYWAASRGCVVVCGAGNTADSRVQYPAAYASSGVAVAVTAAQRDGAAAPFDTHGDWIDVAAPGVDVLSTWPGYANAYGSELRDYAVTSGTSLAAPFVTGMAGLALSVDSSLAAGDFRELLRRTARDPGYPGAESSMACGLADAPRLLEALSPPFRLLHGEATAESWHEDGAETLHVRGSAFWRAGGAADGDYPARRYEVRAFAREPTALEGRAIWIRATGLGGWRPGSIRDGEECWGEASGGAPGSDAALRTFVYRVDAPPAGCDSCPPLGWLPRAPWDVVFPWTRWGVERPLVAAPGGPRLERLSALPARGTIRFRVTGVAPGAPGLATLVLIDVRGRRVASLGLAPTGDGAAHAEWRGQDEAGRIAPAGLYIAIYRDGAARVATRFLWLR